jgi:hypothetical protein
VTGSIAVDEALLALKIAFLVLLYLFIWMIVRSATRDVRVAPQESIILGAAEANALRAVYAPQAARAHLRVIASATLPVGSTVGLAAPVQVGRGPECDLHLDDDDYVSSRHARFDPRADGVWVEDLGSTNGTFVNGARVTTARLLHGGDVVRVGHTDLEVAL